MYFNEAAQQRIGQFIDEAAFEVLVSSTPSMSIPFSANFLTSRKDKIFEHTYADHLFLHCKYCLSRQD